MRLTPLANHRPILPRCAGWLMLALEALWLHGPRLGAISQARLRLAILEGNAQAARAALEQGADPNAKHGAGSEASPLACALASRWSSGAQGLACARALIDAGADASERLGSERRESLICKALRQRDLPMAWLLLSAGADPWAADAHGAHAISESQAWLALEAADPRRSLAVGLRQLSADAEKGAMESLTPSIGKSIELASPRRI